MSRSEERPLTEEEKELLARLLALPAAERDLLRDQARVAVGRTLDEYGSFAIEVPGLSKNRDVQTPYAEAQALDQDGVPVWITLFTKNGVLDEIEVARADGLPLLRPISMDGLDVFHPSRSR